jgi:hypothetical protein
VGSAENVYSSAGASSRVTQLLVCFPPFTGRRECVITSGRITAPLSFFRTALDGRGRRATQFRRQPGFRTLRYGPGAVATPTALDASKEDVGKGGASPAPLPKVLAIPQGNRLAVFLCESLRTTTAGQGLHFRIGYERIVSAKKVLRKSCLRGE